MLKCTFFLWLCVALDIINYYTFFAECDVYLGLFVGLARGLLVGEEMPSYRPIEYRKLQFLTILSDEIVRLKEMILVFNSFPFLQPQMDSVLLTNKHFGISYHS